MAINGTAGNDTLNGTNAIETIDGLAGLDTVSYAASANAVTVNLLTGVNTGGDAAGDTLINIENITGSALNDNLTGNDGDNVLSGGLGNDTMQGGKGNDTVDGGDGNDNIGGGQGDDVITGGTGNDTLRGALGNDDVSGGEGDDTLDESNDISGLSRNLLAGNQGNDRIYGGSGVDSLQGGQGDDLLLGNGGNDNIRAGKGSDSVWGGLGDDVVYLADNGDASSVVDYVYFNINAAPMAGDASDSDTIHDFMQGVDKIRLLNNSSSANVTSLGTVVGLDIEGGQVTLEGNKVLFSNGAEATFVGLDAIYWDDFDGVTAPTFDAPQDVLGEAFQAAVAGFNPANIVVESAEALSIADVVSLLEAGFALDNLTYEISDVATTIQAALSTPALKAILENAEQVTATGDELNNPLAFTAFGPAINLRIEANEGDDSILAGKGDDAIVGGQGADQIALTTNDESSDDIVYTSSDDGASFNLARVTFGALDEDYRAGGDLNIDLEINGNEESYYYTIPEALAGNRDAVLADFAQQVHAELAQDYGINVAKVTAENGTIVVRSKAIGEESADINVYDADMEVDAVASVYTATFTNEIDALTGGQLRLVFNDNGTEHVISTPMVVNVADTFDIFTGNANTSYAITISQVDGNMAALSGSPQSFTFTLNDEGTDYTYTVAVGFEMTAEQKLDNPGLTFGVAVWAAGGNLETDPDFSDATISGYNHTLSNGANGGMFDVMAQLLGTASGDVFDVSDSYFPPDGPIPGKSNLNISFGEFADTVLNSTFVSAETIPVLSLDLETSVENLQTAFELALGSEYDSDIFPVYATPGDTNSGIVGYDLNVTLDTPELYVEDENFGIVSFGYTSGFDLDDDRQMGSPVYLGKDAGTDQTEENVDATATVATAIFSDDPADYVLGATIQIKLADGDDEDSDPDVISYTLTASEVGKPDAAIQKLVDAINADTEAVATAEFVAGEVHEEIPGEPPIPGYTDPSSIKLTAVDTGSASLGVVEADTGVFFDGKAFEYQITFTPTAAHYAEGNVISISAEIDADGNGLIEGDEDYSFSYTIDEEDANLPYSAMINFKNGLVADLDSKGIDATVGLVGDGLADINGNFAINDRTLKLTLDDPSTTEKEGSGIEWVDLTAGIAVPKTDNVVSDVSGLSIDFSATYDGEDSFTYNISFNNDPETQENESLDSFTNVFTDGFTTGEAALDAATALLDDAGASYVVDGLNLLINDPNLDLENSSVDFLADVNNFDGEDDSGYLTQENEHVVTFDATYDAGDVLTVTLDVGGVDHIYTYTAGSQFMTFMIGNTPGGAFIGAVGPVTGSAIASAFATVIGTNSSPDNIEATDGVLMITGSSLYSVDTAVVNVDGSIPTAASVGITIVGQDDVVAALGEDDVDEELGLDSNEGNSADATTIDIDFDEITRFAGQRISVTVEGEDYEATLAGDTEEDLRDAVEDIYDAIGEDILDGDLEIDSISGKDDWTLSADGEDAVLDTRFTLTGDITVNDIDTTIEDGTNEYVDFDASAQAEKITSIDNIPNNGIDEEIDSLRTVIGDDAVDIDLGDSNTGIENVSYIDNTWNTPGSDWDVVTGFQIGGEDGGTSGLDQVVLDGGLADSTLSGQVDYVYGDSDNYWNDPTSDAGFNLGEDFGDSNELVLDTSGEDLDYSSAFSLEIFDDGLLDDKLRITVLHDANGDNSFDEADHVYVFEAPEGEYEDLDDLVSALNANKGISYAEPILNIMLPDIADTGLEISAKVVDGEIVFVADWAEAMGFGFHSFWNGNFATDTYGQLSQENNWDQPNFDLDTNEFGIVNRWDNENTDSYAVEAANLTDADAVSNLLNQVFDFNGGIQLMDMDEPEVSDGKINTSVFAVTASDNDHQTAIWVHTQSDADDDTVSADELQLLALLNTDGEGFDEDNFDIANLTLIDFEGLTDNYWYAPVTDGYRGLDWDGFVIALNTNYSSDDMFDVFDNALTSGSAVGVQVDEDFQFSSSDDDFDFIAGNFAAGFGEDSEATVIVSAWDNGEQVGSATLTIGADRAYVNFLDGTAVGALDAVFEGTFDNIDEVRFTADNIYAMDDLLLKSEEESGSRIMGTPGDDVLEGDDNANEFIGNGGDDVFVFNIGDTMHYLFDGGFNDSVDGVFDDVIDGSDTDVDNGDQFKDFDLITDFAEGDAIQFPEHVDHLEEDDDLDGSDVLVFHGIVSDGVFTVTANIDAGYTPEELANTTHTLLVFDDDASGNESQAGVIVLAGIFEYDNWSFGDSGLMSYSALTV